MLRRAMVVALLIALAPLPASAATTQYNPRRAGHPLRIIAYALHPVGVLLDYAIFRPAWWVGTHEPLRTIFGVQIVVDDSAEIPRQVERGFDESAPEPLQEPPPPEPGTEPPQD